MNCSWPGSSIHGISQARILQLSCHFLLQGIFPSQGSDPHLLHWQADSLQLSQLESPSVQFSSVAQSCSTLCDPMNCSTPGLPVHHRLLESTQVGRSNSGASQMALVVKTSPSQFRRHKRCKFNPWIGKIPWRRAWQPTPVFLPGESHGQRSLVGYSPRGCKESDTTEAT